MSVMNYVLVWYINKPSLTHTHTRNSAEIWVGRRRTVYICLVLFLAFCFSAQFSAFLLVRKVAIGFGLAFFSSLLLVSYCVPSFFFNTLNFQLLDFMHFIGGLLDLYSLLFISCSSRMVFFFYFFFYQVWVASLPVRSFYCLHSRTTPLVRSGQSLW